MQIPIIKGDKVGADAQWNDSLPQNMYAVLKPVLGADGFMATFPGIEPAAVASDLSGYDRGAVWVSNPAFIGQYRVVGNSLVKLVDDPNESLDLLETLGTVPGTGQVRLAYSFNNLAIVADGRLYYYNPTAGFREITDPEVGNPIDIVWGDNLFILTDGENIYHSDPLDEESFLPLDFGTADFQPDPSLGLGFNEDSELIAFGTLSVEHLTNVGATNFVFRRIKQKAQKIGIVSTVSKGYYGNIYYMLGTRENSQFGVYVTESGASQKISSIAVDKILSNYQRSELQGAIVEVIELDGVVLCLIHLPDTVLCFNQSASKQRGIDNSWSVITSALDTDLETQLAGRAYNYVHDKQLNKWYVGDKYTFVIGRLDLDRGDEYNTPKEFIFDTPLIPLETLSIDSLELRTVPGAGAKFTVYGRNEPEPEFNVFVSRTTDGRIYGREWSRLASTYNNYQTRFYINRLGYVPNYIGFRFRGYGKTRMSFCALDVRAS